MNDDSEKTNQFDLTGAFVIRQTKLCADLGLSDISSHPGTKGDQTELDWLRMLEEFLPKRYGVAKAFVVDSRGHQSEQIDVVIHDRHFSLLFFEVGGAKYIPAESVYAAFEVKQNLDKGNLEYAADKIASVRKLHRTSIEIPHAGGLYDPILTKRIIGGILTRRSDWSPPFGSAFEKCLNDLDAQESTGLTYGLDVGCAVEDGGFVVNRDKNGVRQSIDHSEANVALIYFVMRLLRKLQVVGSAPAIDYDEYFKSVPGTP
jgi:hypothetical protein